MVNPKITLPPMWGKNVAHSILQSRSHLHNRSKTPCVAETTINEAYVLVDELHKRIFFIIENLISFLHSQSDYITASAPTLKRTLYLWSIPRSQLSKTFTTLHGSTRQKLLGWLTMQNEQNYIGRIIVLLSYHDDKRHIFCFHANCVLQGCRQ